MIAWNCISDAVVTYGVISELMERVNSVEENNTAMAERISRLEANNSVLTERIKELEGIWIFLKISRYYQTSKVLWFD